MRGLLQADQVRIGVGDLLGEHLGARREVRGLDCVPDLRACGGERRKASGGDRRGQIGAQVQVEGHNLGRPRVLRLSDAGTYEREPAEHPCD